MLEDGSLQWRRKGMGLSLVGFLSLETGDPMPPRADVVRHLVRELCAVQICGASHLRGCDPERSEPGLAENAAVENKA